MIQTLFHSFTLLGLGFTLGLQHSLEVDHVVAVSTLVSQSKSLKKSALLGVFWGIGHTTTLFFTGLVVLIFKLSIPEQMSRIFEFGIGLLLVILGADLLRKVIRGEIHLHEHEHEGGVVHTHFHAHSQSRLHHHAHRSLVVGMLHGLAGGGALVLLVLTTVESIPEGLLFILIFGIGSIMGMLVTSTLIALPFKFITRSERLNTGLRVFAGVVSILLGCFVMIEMALTSM